MKKILISLLLPTLLAGTHFPAQAQDTRADTVTLIASHVPVREALHTLFTGAGIRDFVIAPNVRGSVNLSLDGVPFSVALKQILSAVTPPLAADFQGGTYHVRLWSAAPPLLETPGTETPGLEATSLSAPSEDSDQSNFYKIGIKHYDAGVIADALTQPNGIVLLPPNFVIPANAAPPPATAGATGNSGPTLPTGNTATAGRPLGRNVLPPGVKRIFVLESDNSLVVEASAQGYDNLTGSRLLSDGFTQVY